jgi:Fe-S cluster biogenesis protein NfuA
MKVNAQPAQDREATRQSVTLDALLDDLESFPDPDARSRMTAIVRGLMAFYGEGLARILAIIEQHDDPEVSTDVLAALTDDDLVAHLLLLHDLHPVPVEIRVARALEEVRPYLHSHGGNVELIEVVEGVARLRLQGSCQGCPSSTITLKLAIEEAIMKAAPDVLQIVAEGAAEPQLPRAFVPMATLQRRGRTDG